jgi:hypothetical protein
MGLFMPKLSITAFYWWLIPNVFRNMRYLLWITTFYVIAAALCSVLVDIFICYPVDYNWSLDYDKQGQSIWNSWTDFLINWGLNFSADVLRRSALSALLFMMVLMFNSFLHSLLHHQVSSASPKTEVWSDRGILSRYSHHGHQFWPLHDIHSLKL